MHSWEDNLDRVPRTIWLGLTILLFCGVFALDWVTGPVLSVALFYLVPITLSAWTLGRLFTLAVALFSEASWVLVRIFQTPGMEVNFDFYWNSFVRLAIYLSFALLLSWLKETLRALSERERQVRNLAAAVMRAQEEERLRISRELHDQASQDLTVLTFGFEDLSRQVSSEEPEGRKRSILKINELKHLTEVAIQNIRRLAFHLRPKLLEDMGLREALSWLGREQFEKRGMKVNYDVHGMENRLSPETELALYRVSQEACANVVKHSGASAVDIRLSGSNDRVSLEISDNGCGFSKNGGAGLNKNRLGILGMRERIELLGGKFFIESSPGKGTTIQAILPLAQDRKKGKND